jgi:single-strand DNA-binding protein
MALSKFSLATSRSYKKNDEYVNETTWHNITVWGKEKLMEKVHKGANLTVVGRIQNRSYEAQDGTKKYVSEVVADEIILHGARSGGGGEYDGDSVRQEDAIPEDDTPF